MGPTPTAYSVQTKIDNNNWTTDEEIELVYSIRHETSFSFQWMEKCVYLNFKQIVGRINIEPNIYPDYHINFPYIYLHDASKNKDLFYLTFIGEKQITVV